MIRHDASGSDLKRSRMRNLISSGLVTPGSNMVFPKKCGEIFEVMPNYISFESSGPQDNGDDHRFAQKLTHHFLQRFLSLNLEHL